MICIYHMICLRDILVFYNSVKIEIDPYSRRIPRGYYDDFDYQICLLSLVASIQIIHL